MHALIDADRIAYAFGGFKDEDGQPLSWPLVAERVDSNIQGILQGCGANSRTLYLTADDKSNFRIRLATIRIYKGHRSTDKPFWYEHIRRYLTDQYEAQIVYGMEADDAIGIEQCRRMNHCYSPALANWNVVHPEWPPVICSVDKDLNNIPGYHYNELHPEKGVYWVSDISSLSSFYSQLLIGDATDNIPGLYGVGPRSAAVLGVGVCDNEFDMYCLVRDEYEKRFGSYWKRFLTENAMLLWIKRQEGTMHFEIVNRLMELEDKRNLEADSKTESENNLMMEI